MLDPIIRFFTEDEGWQHLAVIAGALIFSAVMHVYDRWKNGRGG